MWHSLNMGNPKIWIGYFKLLYKPRETKRLAMSKGNHSSWRFVLMIWMGTGYWFRSKNCHELGWIFWGNPPRPWRSKSLRKNGGHGQVASGHPCHIMLVSNQCRKWDLIWNNIILVWFQHIGSIVFTLVWCQQMMLAFKIKSYVSIMWLRTNDSSDSITYGLPLSNLRLLQVAETWEPSVDHDKFKVYELYLHSTPRWKNQ